MDAEDEVPLIMGSPLLVDGRTLIDVVVEELIMRVNNEEVVFSVFKTKQYLKDANDCFLVNASCGAIAKTQEIVQLKDPLEAILIKHGCDEDEERKEWVAFVRGITHINWNS